MITADDLLRLTKRALKNKRLIVGIQREPYMHVKTDDGIKVEKTAGGAHTLLDGILKQVNGVMVALASGDADKLVVDEKGRIKIPPKEKNYTLKRIFLSKKDYDGFYYGFANQTLWPLCHVVFIKPVFSHEWWNAYVKVNQEFTNAILDEVGAEEALVWINDYHLALVPQMLKEKNPKIRIGTFWHIPWPTYEVFRICPWRKQIIEGLLGSDFIGFHRGYHVENFIECSRRELEVIVDSEPRSVTYKNHHTKLENIPAGIDYHEIKARLENQKPPTEKLIKKDFGFDYEFLAIGVDRIDYTKGLIERLNIIDRFLEKYPKFKEKFVYLSIAAPSRTRIPAYKDLNKQIEEKIEEINAKYSIGGWKPIHFINKIFLREKIFSYYQLADLCMVTSLDDGMNLVAKEYVICAPAEKGALLLSKFTGAAKDLRSAFLINPYDIDGTVDALLQALTMKKEERAKRMNEMKAVVKENNIYDWAMKFIEKTVSDF
ncbi:MAG: trehalose-6-phosphate synthase [Candidatus Roizmanbacteria bacterium]|nr:MAG: trehalose-6-phosphate synthase [Candidatus Roizmanbacteria bacterium]